MTVLGGLAALRFRDYKHLILGLAAGLMLGVVSFDLLPEALNALPDLVFHIPSALVLFTVGFLVLHVLERSLAIHRGHEGEYEPHRHEHVGLFAASALVGHSFFDGF